MKTKQQPATDTPHHVAIGQQAAQGMSAAPSHEFGALGHQAHLNETYGTHTPVPQPTRRKRG